MTTPANSIRRVERLEQSNVALRELTSAEAGRAALRGANRSTYVAKTIRVGGSYPANGDTFGLRFIDRAYTPTEGPQAVTDTPRSAAAQVVGRTIDGSYLLENTVVVVIPAPPPPGTTGSGRWHIIPPSIPFQIYLGKADALIPQDSTTGVVSRYTGGAETDSGLNDTVINKWPDIPPGSWVIYAAIGAAMYVIAPSGGAADSSGIWAVNRSGVEIPPHGALFVPDSETIAGTVYLQAYQPTSEFDQIWLVNGPAPVAPAATFRGFWRTEQSGPVTIVPGSDPLADIGWGPSPRSFELSPNRPGGFLLLNKTSRIVGGQRVADFLQTPVTTVYGKLYEDLDLTQYPAGNVSAEFEIWHRGGDGRLRPSGWDKISAWPFWLNKNEKVKAGTKGRADFYADHWEADFACDTDDTDPSQASPGAMQEPFIFQGPDTSDSTQQYYAASPTGVGKGR